MDRPIILVTGANGQLGSEIRVMAASFPDLHFVFVSRQELAIEDKIAVEKYFEELRPAFCVNCAAYTAVDKAESERETAFFINGDAPGILSAASKHVGAKFIHISTDYVF